ncbi:hypothetical protein LTS12_028158, partial [Elasticomyces elasticus]
MAIPPKFAGQKLLATATQEPQHTLELFLDYVCPFSAKQFNTFYASARPIITQEYSSKLQVIFRQQVQPWHPSSTLTHEAAVAVLKVAPGKFWQFSSDLFKHQEEFFDANVVNETRNKTYERLAKIAGGAGINENEILKLLIVKDHADENGQLNTGNQVTNDLKLMIR